MTSILHLWMKRRIGSRGSYKMRVAEYLLHPHYFTKKITTVLEYSSTEYE
mgnify:CR=1 FL=1